MLLVINVIYRILADPTCTKVLFVNSYACENEPPWPWDPHPFSLPMNGRCGALADSSKHAYSSKRISRWFQRTARNMEHVPAQSVRTVAIRAQTADNGRASETAGIPAISIGKIGINQATPVWSGTLLHLLTAQWSHLTWVLSRNDTFLKCNSKTIFTVMKMASLSYKITVKSHVSWS